MADFAITNGGAIAKRDLRYASYNGAISSTNQTIVSNVADKQIVVWKAFGGLANSNSNTRLLLSGAPIAEISGGYRGSNTIDFGDTPVVYPTNTSVQMDNAGSTGTGTYAVIYSIIDPIDRT